MAHYGSIGNISRFLIVRYQSRCFYGRKGFIFVNAFQRLRSSFSVRFSWIVIVQQYLVGFMNCSFLLVKGLFGFPSGFFICSSSNSACFHFCGPPFFNLAMRLWSLKSCALFSSNAWTFSNRLLFNLVFTYPSWNRAISKLKLGNVSNWIFSKRNIIITIRNVRGGLPWSQFTIIVSILNRQITSLFVTSSIDWIERSATRYRLKYLT